MSPTNRRTTFVLLLATTVAVAGCAEERAPVNRVQPYALDKAFFVGEDFASTADDPEFWSQTMIVDVPYGSTHDGLFTSWWAPTVRIRWQITEELLLGRLAYERIENGDGTGLGGPTEDGVIVVAYPIESHFDIVRQYNPTTGEEINVLEENTTDRPWHERRYMRVDWSRSLNTGSYDFDTLSGLAVMGAYDFEPLDYDVTDPNDPNAPVFDLEHGYFDVTNKVLASPQVIDISHLGWGYTTLPQCWFDGDFMNGTFPWGNCNPTEVTIRQSFLRVEDRDFQPLDWDGWRFQAFGGLTEHRLGFARNYGMSDDMWHRFLDYHNIWERSHYYADPVAMTGAVPCFTPETTPYGADPHRDVDPRDGTEDECAAAGPGSKCDTFSQKCTLPFARRTPKPAAVYYTNGSNPEYFDSTAEALHDWDVALRAAVRTAQYAECRATGGDQEACVGRFPIWFGQMDDYQDATWLFAEVDKCRNGRAYARERDCNALADRLGRERDMDPAVIDVAKMDEMLVLCHSPVQADDPALCGGPRLPVGVTAEQCQYAYRDGTPDQPLYRTCQGAFNVRKGDLRYNKVTVVWEPQTLSPWGFGADSVDPLTGEVVAMNTTFWSHVTDMIAQDTVDKLRFLEGELSAEEVTEGEYVRNWAQAAESASRGGVAPLMSRQQFADRLAAVGGAAGAAAVPAAMPAGVAREVQEVKRALQGVKASLDAPSSAAATYAARRQAARGTAFEAELLTPMVQQYAGVSGMPVDQGVMDIASPLRGGDPELRLRLRQLKEQAYADRGICLLEAREAQAPFSFAGLAEILQQKFGEFNRRDPAPVQAERAERMRRYIAHRMHRAGISHEFGHSIGLRHNFVGSSDAFMYRPQYWQLRTKNGTVTEPCTELTPDGESCVGPRWFDPVTEEERDNLIWMWTLGSIMDYAGEYTQDFLGPAIWDFGGARAFHGDAVAVNPDPEFRFNTPKGRAALEKMDNFGGILGIRHSLDDGDPTTNDDYHYSQLQSKLGMIRDCVEVDPWLFEPPDWDEERMGEWHPLLDGLIVRVDGRWTRCKQPRVDYVQWTEQRFPTVAEAGPYYRGGPSIDREGRTRIPYGFGTDSWADLGNVSVYRHDNGADPYEIFNFLITSQETWQVFETYRRNRMSFTVRGAADRIFARYNAKIRDGAKGLGLIRNIYEDYALEDGLHFGTLWPYVATFFPENVVAASLAFDHFVRQAQRPEVGPHFFRPWEDFLRSARDTIDNPGGTKVIIPNGISAVGGTASPGGKLVENLLSEDHGEYDTWYTLNSGSYYDKMNVAILMTESVDNYISSTRNDFVDPRYRAVSMADLFPDGFRRWLGNALTGDEVLKGPRVIADEDGDPLIDFERYSRGPIGWTTWWTAEPQVCFPAEQTTICSSYHLPTSDPFHPLAPDHTAVLDPQLGWEQQKFLIAWTMLFLFENEEMNWLDQLRVYEKGRDPDPGLRQYVEFHSPDGKVYVAQTFGRETIFGKTVQKGIAARVLEWANELLVKAYETTPGPDLDGDTAGDWPELVYAVGTGRPIVRWDRNVRYIASDGSEHPEGIPGCNERENHACDCSSNLSCMQLQRYLSVPAYLREAVYAYQLGQPERRGVWD